MAILRARPASRFRRVLLLAAGVALVPLTGAAGGMVAVAATAPSPSGCAGWTVRSVASGLGSVENLTPDGAGGFFIASTDRSAVERVAADGTRRTVVSGVDTPGGLVLQGRTLYFNSGDSPLNTIFGFPGYIGRVNLDTGATAKLATVLAPNGLAALPDGSLAATSSALPGASGITRVVPATGQIEQNWARVPHSNGAALRGNVLFTDDPYTGAVLAVPLTPAVDGSPLAGAAKTVASLGTTLDVLDDLAADGSGMLYVAANYGGRIERVDPATGAHCVIATMKNPSSVRIATGPRGPALYVSSFDGTLREISPPAGVSLS